MKLGVFFFGNRMELTGAGAVVRSFANNDDVFASNGVDQVRIYDLTPKKEQSKSDNKKNSFVKQVIAKGLSFTAWGANLLIEKLYLRKGIQVVNNYFNTSKLDEDALIFHEIFTCLAYVERSEKEKRCLLPFTLVLHTNGEIFKMLRTYYPAFAHSKYESFLEKRILDAFAKAKKIIFVSQLSCNHFCDIYPMYKDKAIVVYNGISDTGINYEPSFDGKVRMVTVGTVNARKNQRLLVDVLAKLNRNDIFLTVVGGGNKLEECKQSAINLGVDKYIKFLGPRKDVDAILKDANLYVMSSFDEGLPISAIEALRAKLPLILTDVGGNRELIDGNGYLVKPELDSLATSLSNFADNVTMQEEMSRKSYQIFQKRFMVETMISKYCSIFNEIIQ